MDSDQRYTDWEMERVQPLDHGGYLVKFVGFHSETRWLEITQEQFDKIRAVLTGQG
jgi:hypothetical protein